MFSFLAQCPCVFFHSSCANRRDDYFSKVHLGRDFSHAKRGMYFFLGKEGILTIIPHTKSHIFYFVLAWLKVDI